MDFCPKVDAQSHTDIMGHDKVSKSLRTLELVILQPLFHKRQALLLQDRLRNFDTFLLVQPAAFQKRREVHQDGWNLIWLRRQLLESSNSSWRTQSIAALRHNSGSLLCVSLTHETFKLRGKQVLCSRQVQTTSNLQSKLSVAKSVQNIRNQSLPVQLKAEHRSLAHSDTENCSSSILRTGHKDGVVGNLVTVHAGTSVTVKHVCVSHLGHHESNLVLLIDCKTDREVSGSVSGNRDGYWRDLKGWSLAGVTTNFLDVELGWLSWGFRLLLVENQQLRRILSPGNFNCAESGRVTL
mmetsp:Transcript_126312/g.353718  ORF Transcript_126312/g.353718 Transcript_126312/m.353718 type:complete len:296 (-) Transcript_126312:332-1219(-)